MPEQTLLKHIEEILGKKYEDEERKNVMQSQS
jgi:hypothetical protein